MAIRTFSMEVSRVTRGSVVLDSLSTWHWRMAYGCECRRALAIERDNAGHRKLISKVLTHERARSLVGRPLQTPDRRQKRITPSRRLRASALQLAPSGTHTRAPTTVVTRTLRSGKRSRVGLCSSGTACVAATTTALYLVRLPKTARFDGGRGGAFEPLWAGRGARRRGGVGRA